MIDLRFALAALRNVWGPIQAAQPPAPSLRAALQAKSDAQFQIVQSGGVSGVSGNGHDVRFERSDVNPLSPLQVLDTWVYLVDRFDNSLATLQTAGIANPTDTQVEVQMESTMRAVFGYTDNWMFMAK